MPRELPIPFQVHLHTLISSTWLSFCLKLPKHRPLVSNLSVTKRAFLLAVWICEMSDISIGLYINKIRKVKAGKAKWKALKKAKLFGPKDTFLFVGKHLFPAPLSPLLPFFVPSPFFSLVLSLAQTILFYFNVQSRKTCSSHVVLMTATKIASVIWGKTQNGHYSWWVICILCSLLTGIWKDPMQIWPRSQKTFRCLTFLDFQRIRCMNVFKHLAKVLNKWFLKFVSLLHLFHTVARSEFWLHCIPEAM